MLPGRARNGKSELEVEQLWDARDFASLKVKKDMEQVT